MQLHAAPAAAGQGPMRVECSGLSVVLCECSLVSCGVRRFSVRPTSLIGGPRRLDNDDPEKIFRLARDRACWSAGAASGRWAWRGRGARRGSCRVRVVCRAERRRDKFKRQRRSGVMVCVSVFVTHQEARDRF